MTGPGEEGPWSHDSYMEPRVRRRPDAVEELMRYVNMRPGTSSSDVNVLAMNVSVPLWVLLDLADEIKKHRAVSK